MYILIPVTTLIAKAGKNKITAILPIWNKIKEILYPYNPSSKNYKLWKKYYSGATSLFSIVIKSRKKSSVIKFVNSLELFGIGYSWGGFESLALHQSNLEIGKRNYLKLEKDEHLVRLHIGLEDAKDIINDIKQALKHLKWILKKNFSNQILQ